MSLAGTVPTLKRLGPFAAVLDVGGNVGEWAELARGLWPDCRLTSFEPLPFLAAANRQRARGRWWVEEVAVSDATGAATLHVCTNQHSASTMQEPGSVRREQFGIRDRFEDVTVETFPLDRYLPTLPPSGRLLVKVDVEGHEHRVLAGARLTLRWADAVIVEVQQSPAVFGGAAPPDVIDAELRAAGLYFAGVLGCLEAPGGEIVQFDGLWTR